MADNAHKGTSESPVPTIHSTPAFAAEHLEQQPEAWIDLLLDAAQPFLESRPAGAAGHPWRYAEPATVLDLGSIVLEHSPPVVLAGEMLAGAGGSCPVGVVCGPGGRGPARIDHIAMAGKADTPKPGGTRLHDQRYAN